MKKFVDKITSSVSLADGNINAEQMVGVYICAK